jgi:hypothetical protein
MQTAIRFLLANALAFAVSGCPSSSDNSDDVPPSSPDAGDDSPANAAAGAAGTGAPDADECRPSCEVIVRCDPDAGSLDDCLAACMSGLGVGEGAGAACLAGYRAQNRCVEALDCDAYANYAAQSPPASYPCKSARDQLVRGCNPPPVDTDNRVTMLLDGEPWSSGSVDVVGWPPSIIHATDSSQPGGGLVLSLPALTGPGSYSLSLSGSSWATGSGLPQDIYVIGGGGTIEVATLTDDRLTATFELSLKNATGTATVEITGGMIDVGP